jgi:hypothetical protein
MLSIVGAKVSEVELDGGPITSMSALGHKQTFRSAIAMSALPPKADMCGATWDVRFGPLADIRPICPLSQYRRPKSSR